MSDAVTSQTLGPLIRRFQPSLLNVLAAAGMALLLFGGGLGVIIQVVREIHLAGWNLSLFAGQGTSWLMAALELAIGLALISGGLWFARYTRRLREHDVALHEHGFRCRQGGVQTIVRWEEIAAIRETIFYERPPVLKGVAPMPSPNIDAKMFVVVTKVGAEFRFTQDTVNGVQHFGALLRERAVWADLSWQSTPMH